MFAPGLLTCLLTCLDEDGNEFYSKAEQMVEAVRQKITDDVFYRILFTMCVSQPQSRLAICNYLRAHYPKAFEYKKLIVAAVSELLSDGNVLVQRLAMEMVVTRLPLPKRQLSDTDIVTLMQSALCVVLKKEVSLNRRLYTWLTEAADSEWTFECDSLPLVHQAIKNMLLRNDGEVEDQTRPYKVLTSLLDWPEIGNAVASLVVVDILQHLISMQQSQHFVDMAQTVNTYLNALDQFIVWRQVAEMVAGTGHVDELQIFVDRIRLEDDESV